MTGARILSARVPLFAALASALAGCMFIAPLDDYPSTKDNHPGGAGGSGNSSGAGGVLGSAAGAPEAGAPNGGGTGGCQTNQDCALSGAGEPYLCRPSDHRCVALKSEECPLAYGTASDPNAIVFGAFATLNAGVPEDNAIVWAHRLALDELSGDANGGLPDGPNGKRRPLVMVVCNNSPDTVDTGLAHLADDLEVPAVLATLKPGDLRRGFEAHRDRDIFFLSPTGATRTLVEYPDDGLIWNLLGQPSDLAPTYAKLLTLAEAYVKNQQSLTSLRVALVTTNEAFDSELASFVEPVLSFNGQSVTANSDAGNFAGFTVDTSDPQPESWAQQIIAFHPDIIISTASETFSQVGGLLETLESDWQQTDATAPRPFYILSPYNAGDLTSVHDLIVNLISGGVDAEANRRFTGVGIAGPADITLQNQYATRLGTAFQGAYADTGNYYDASYFLAYAMYAAGTDAPLTGSSIAAAMPRLINGKAIDVGPANISAAFQALSKAGATIELDGTLGPPNFDPATGVRHDQGSVLCFKLDQGVVSLETDVLRYDTELGQFQGTFPCFDGFYP